MRKNLKTVAYLSFLLMVSLSGCNLGLSAPVEDVMEETQPVIPITGGNESGPVATDTATVQHETVPGNLPEKQSGLAGDQDSSSTAPDKRAPDGDRFTFGRYERPFNANEMDVYYPAIDIINTQVYQDDNWLYGVITMKEGDAGCRLDGRYAFEIDWDLNGGGDLLVLAAAPFSSDWSTDSVEVWFDENNDVGGLVKITADEKPLDANGFETQLFGAGVGDDPDLAWARTDPNDPCTVQFALKRSSLQGNFSYLIGMWAGHEMLDPALFDHNDRFTHEQAGSSLKEFEFFYPIKSIYELDNSCRMAIGFQPTGKEPGLCPLPPGAEPEYDEPAGCPAEYLVCFNFGRQTVCYCTQQ